MSFTETQNKIIELCVQNSKDIAQLRIDSVEALNGIKNEMAKIIPNHESTCPFLNQLKNSQRDYVKIVLEGYKPNKQFIAIVAAIVVSVGGLIAAWLTKLYL